MSCIHAFQLLKGFRLFTEQRFTVEVLLELDESSVSAVTEFKGEQLLLLKRIKEYKLVSVSKSM